MSKIVNLHSARKQRSRAKRKAAADENAARFGKSAAQRTLEKADRETRAKNLDGHLRDRGAPIRSPESDANGRPDD